MGKYCVEGSSSQKDCEAGTYNPVTQQDTCLDCPAGKFYRGPGAVPRGEGAMYLGKYLPRLHSTHTEETPGQIKDIML